MCIFIYRLYIHVYPSTEAAYVYLGTEAAYVYLGTEAAYLSWYGGCIWV
jgi:hypothetical protein